MFDMMYGPWLVLGVVSLILIRPDDWVDLAFKAGRLYRYMHAYINEWRDYIEDGIGKPSSPRQSIDNTCYTYPLSFSAINTLITLSQRHISQKLYE